MKKSILLTGLLLGAVSSAYADDESDSKYKWSGTGQLGFTSTSGNTDTTSITAGLKITLETGKWISDVALDILNASNNGKDTADRFIVSSKTGYKFNQNNYFYYGSRYENDNFSGYDYVMSSGVGWGHKFQDSKETRLIMETGLGYKIQALDIDRSETTGMAFLGKLDYMHQLTDNMSFENLTVIESSSDNTFIQNDAGLAFKVSDKFKVKLAHQYRHNTVVPVGTDTTDTLVSANLVYDF